MNTVRVLQKVFLSLFLATLLCFSSETVTAMQIQDRILSAEIQKATLVQLQEQFYKTEIEKQIQVELEDATLEEALAQITRETGLKLTYRGDIMVDKEVTLVNEEISVSDALSHILEGTDLEYKFSRDGYLLISRMDEVEEKRYQETISGQVTDGQTGESLPGVNIIVEGTTTGTSTGPDGNFELEVSNLQGTIIFTYIGYITQEVAINGRTSIDIALEQVVQSMAEVVVVGYGTREKGQLTGSISNVSGEALTKVRTADLSKSLQGVMPGLIISDRGGEPGNESVEINIRGTHTLGNNSPLVIIDGVPRSGLGQLSAEDIEEISVLKDASAAIYGARAANGVIVVKTKRGKAGEFSVRFKSSYGINSLTRIPNMMGSWQWATYQNEVQRGFGQQPLFSDEDIQKYKDGSNPITHPNTDFYGLTFRQYSPEVMYNISATGGTEQVKYFISGDYLGKESQYTSRDGEYNQYQLRSNIDAQVHEYLNIGMDLNLRIEDGKLPSNSASNIIHRVYFNYPTEPAFYPNGLPYFTREGGGNPVVMNSFKMGWNQKEDKIIQTKLSFDLNMDWLTKGLELIGYGAIDYDIGNDEVHDKPALLYKYNQNMDEYDEMWSAGLMSLEKTSDVLTNDLYHIRLAYNNNFGDHNISTFAAYEQNESEYENQYAYRRTLFSENKVELFAGEEDGRVVDGTSFVEGRVNYFGHFAYDYDRKYLLDFTIRRDGSFNFSKDNRFGIFPGFSVGWNISKEPFMADTRSVADNIKLRVSYGKMGNDRVPAYQYLTKYGLLPQSSWYNILITGVSPAYNPAMDIINVPNKNITWEVAKIMNYGLDAVLWDKLSMSVDYFRELRQGILIQRNESVPAYTGLELPQENLGEVENSGVELMLDYINQVRNVNFNISGNFSFNRSKIIYMDESKNIPDYQRKEGKPVNSILAYVADGIFSDQSELDNYPHVAGAIPGDIKYVDVNEDGKIDESDRVRHSTSDKPEIQFGLNTGIEYKGFELYAFFQGAARATSPMMFNDSGTKPEYLFTERWTEENRDAVHPRPYAGFSGFQRLSTYHFNDASYVRLKNLELAYNLSSADWVPAESLLKNLRIYLRGRNLWTLDYLKYFDPEVPFVDNNRGSRGRYYPQLITYSAGVNITI